jgi:hypothetical protein
VKVSLDPDPFVAKLAAMHHLSSRYRGQFSEIVANVQATVPCLQK